MKAKGYRIPPSLYRGYRELMLKAQMAFDACRKHIPCRQGCVECCHALFGLFPLEAVLIHEVFLSLPKKIKDKVLVRAKEGLNKLHLVAFVDRVNEFSVSKVPERLRLRCPFLSDSGLCEIYEHRPITCRIYGIPVLINGVVRSCPKSEGLCDGVPPFDLDLLNQRLFYLSGRLLEGWKGMALQNSGLILSMPMAVVDPFGPLAIERKGRAKGT